MLTNIFNTLFSTSAPQKLSTLTFVSYNTYNKTDHDLMLSEYHRSAYNNNNTNTVSNHLLLFWILSASKL